MPFHVRSRCVTQMVVALMDGCISAENANLHLSALPIGRQLPSKTLQHRNAKQIVVDRRSLSYFAYAWRMFSSTGPAAGSPTALTPLLEADHYFTTVREKARGLLDRVAGVCSLSEKTLVGDHSLNSLLRPNFHDARLRPGVR